MQLVGMPEPNTHINTYEKEIAILAAIVQSSQDAIVSKNLEGIVTSWNPGAERLFGYTADEMIGQSITRLILPENLHEETMILDKIRRGERVEHMETIRRHKTGRLINVSVTVSPLMDSKGNIIGASKIGRDITEQKKAQAALEASEQRAWLAIEAAKLGTFDWDLVNNEFNGSERLKEIFGFNRNEQIEHSEYISRLHPDDRDLRDRAVTESVGTGSLQYEARIILPEDNIRWIKVFGKVLYNQLHEPKQIYGTVMDQTDQRLVEERKNQFIAVASHELKTPLTSVKAYAQLLINTYQKSTDTFLKTALTKIDGQVDKMTKLVVDFLNLSKIELDRLPLQLEVFEFSELVREVATDIQLTKSQHTINLQLEQTMMIRADREKISQVLTNLLTNAIKYSPGEHEVNVRLKKQGDSAMLQVIDKGIGIKSEEKEQIFERFYRSRFNDNISFTGFGIGLYISAEIVKRHGGIIGVNSEFGKGSEFYILLPTA